MPCKSEKVRELREITVIIWSGSSVSKFEFSMEKKVLNFCRDNTATYFNLLFISERLPPNISLLLYFRVQVIFEIPVIIYLETSKI